LSIKNPFKDVKLAKKPRSIKDLSDLKTTQNTDPFVELGEVIDRKRKLGEERDRWL